MYDFKQKAKAIVRGRKESEMGEVIEEGRTGTRDDWKMEQKSATNKQKSMDISFDLFAQWYVCDADVYGFRCVSESSHPVLQNNKSRSHITFHMSVQTYK